MVTRERLSIDLKRSILVIDNNNDTRHRKNLIDIIDSCLDLLNAQSSIRNQVFNFLGVITDSNTMSSITVSGSSIYINVNGDIKNTEVDEEILNILLNRELVLV